MKLTEFDNSIIMKEGYDARFNGVVTLDECPYREFSPGEDMWIKGWQIADSKLFNEADEGDDIIYENDDDFYLHYGWFPILEDEYIEEAEYRGRDVKLNKPMRGDVKKFKVFVKGCGKDKDKVKKINFGQKGVKIKRGSKSNRKSFSARHNCKDKDDKCTAGYWSCRSGNKKKGKFW